MAIPDPCLPGSWRCTSAPPWTWSWSQVRAPRGSSIAKTDKNCRGLHKANPVKKKIQKSHDVHPVRNTGYDCRHELSNTIIFMNEDRQTQGKNQRFIRRVKFPLRSKFYKNEADNSWKKVCSLPSNLLSSLQDVGIQFKFVQNSKTPFSSHCHFSGPLPINIQIHF